MLPSNISTMTLILVLLWRKDLNFHYDFGIHYLRYFALEYITIKYLINVDWIFSLLCVVLAFILWRWRFRAGRTWRSTRNSRSRWTRQVTSSPKLSLYLSVSLYISISLSVSFSSLLSSFHSLFFPCIFLALFLNVFLCLSLCIYMYMVFRQSPY